MDLLKDIGFKVYLIFGYLSVLTLGFGLYAFFKMCSILLEGC